MPKRRGEKNRGDESAALEFGFLAYKEVSRSDKLCLYQHRVDVGGWQQLNRFLRRFDSAMRTVYYARINALQWGLK